MLDLNTQLKASLITNKLIINISNEDYQKMTRIISDIKDKYYNQLTYYKETTTNSLEEIKKHSDLIKNIITDVLNSYEIISELEVYVFLTGSYARNTNKKNSDLDLHFSYQQKYKDIIFKYEEIIYYIISQILDMNRTSIHPMLITRLNKDNLTYLKEKLNEESLTVILKNNIKDITYTYKPNIKRRIYLQYGNNNSIENVFKYLREEIKNNNQEWAHTFISITNIEKFNSMYQELFKYEKSITTKEKIAQRKEYIKLKIKEINIYLNELKDNDKLYKISEIKDIYQKKEFTIINEYISYKRDLSLINNVEWLYLNYYQNQIYLRKDKIINDIYNYLFIIKGLVEPLNFDYSLHTDLCFEIKNYLKLLNTINELNNKILKELERE